MVVINYQDQLQSGTFEHAINHLVDNKLNLSVFYLQLHNVNYLLSNDGESWVFESEILDTQKVDYNSRELVKNKPFAMSCQ